MSLGVITCIKGNTYVDFLIPKSMLCLFLLNVQFYQLSVLPASWRRSFTIMPRNCKLFYDN